VEGVEKLSAGLPWLVILRPKAEESPLDAVAAQGFFASAALQLLRT
jgi:hypothetical protein